MFESIKDYVIERIEAKGRAIARCGDALFGCDDYEDASFEERMSGMLGLHGDTWAESKAKARAGAEAGDVIGVSRGIYKHYGVFTDRGTVVHYTSDDSDLQGTIQETPISRFLRNSKRYSVLVFPPTYGKPTEVATPSYSALPEMGQILRGLRKSSKYRLYSPEETISRARSRIGENRYNLLTNNCEHFAIWCKTGLSESHQVNELLDIMIFPTT